LIEAQGASTSDEQSIAELRDQVTVVIPTLNEEAAIGRLIGEVISCGYKRVLVVDGYSKDKTREIASGMGARVVLQAGGGKAGAVLTSIDLVDTPYFLLMDGDYSYDPVSIDRFLPLMNNYDHIIGCRSLNNSHISRSHQLGNRILTLAFNVLFGSNIPDICSGMYMLRTKTAKQLFVDKPGFVVDQEIAAQTIIDGRVTYVPINYRERLGEPKAPTWRQGFRALYTILSLSRSYNPLMLFSALVGLTIVPSLVILAYTAILNYVYSDFHLGLALLGVALLLFGSQGMIVATLSLQFRLLERRVLQRLGKD
jgi:glycosyltransferase involved in cell wall biosynthesis